MRYLVPFLFYAAACSSTGGAKDEPPQGAAGAADGSASGATGGSASGATGGSASGTTGGSASGATGGSASGAGGAGGMAGAAGVGGMAGASGVGGAAGAGGAASFEARDRLADVAVPTCDGVPERAPMELSCASNADCPAGLFCMVETPVVQCSGVQQPPDPGPSACGDAGCPSGSYCFQMARTCLRDDGTCDPTTAPCPEGFVCEPDNPGGQPRCRQLACSEAGSLACGPTRCNAPGDAYELLCPQTCGERVSCPTVNECATYTNEPAPDCRLVHCMEDPSICPPNHRCGDSTPSRNGCSRMPCESASDCDCGVCLLGLCQSRPGVCSTAPQPCLAP